MIKKVLNLHKKSGETPLQTIKRFRVDNPQYQNVKLGYAGRLDPMAEGVLLVLVGEENKNRKKYLGLDKEYFFDILFGVSTDTYDILGLVKDGVKNNDANPTNGNILRTSLENNIKNLKGKFKQKYPPYSSRTVNGKQLWQWAREDALHKTEIPEREVEVREISLVNIYELTKEELRKIIVGKISAVKGDFRQGEILRSWDDFFNQTKLGKFFAASFKINCTAGTYVRSIANALGEQVGFAGALALKILRTRVGSFVCKE